MTLFFDINNEELNEIVEKGVKNLSEETVSEIAKKAVIDYISSPDVIEKIVFDKDSWSSYSNKAPRSWFTEMLAKSFSDEEIQNYREELLKSIDRDGKDIISKTLASVFSDMLFNNDMRMQFSKAIYEIADIRSKLEGR